jgi:hypothetical protein
MKEKPQNVNPRRKYSDAQSAYKAVYQNPKENVKDNDKEAKVKEEYKKKYANVPWKTFEKEKDAPRYAEDYAKLMIMVEEDIASYEVKKASYNEWLKTQPEGTGDESGSPKKPAQVKKKAPDSNKKASAVAPSSKRPEEPKKAHHKSAPKDGKEESPAKKVKHEHTTSSSNDLSEQNAVMDLLKTPQFDCSKMVENFTLLVQVKTKLEEETADLDKDYGELTSVLKSVKTGFADLFKDYKAMALRLQEADSASEASGSSSSSEGEKGSDEDSDENGCTDDDDDGSN